VPVTMIAAVSTWWAIGTYSRELHFRLSRQADVDQEGRAATFRLRRHGVVRERSPQGWFIAGCSSSRNALSDND